MLLAPLASHAQTLRDAAQQAALTNPEIRAQVHAFESADAEKDVAFGAFLPRLDVSAAVGRDRYEQPVREDINRNSTTVTLTQLIYDGFATSNEVDRLDYARRVRLFQLYDITETTTLEVVRAYADVLRYRELVALAEENYVRHRAVFEQIQRKTAAGVGRRVDLEQAAGRLALAESNLLVDTSNLHDVSARFQRLVGSVPRDDMVMPPNLNKGIPSDLRTALKGVENNPALLASIENVRSANSSAKVRNAAFQPRFDFRLRSDRGNNLSSSTGPTGDSRTNTAEVVMSWNLFNGGSDRARLRQYAEEINVARDQRDKTCRDLRQTLEIAYNDTRKLNEQLAYLDQHQLSIEKARDAYRKQFDIGQRSLLDVLDTENELFQSKRSYVNAEYDLSTAYARTQAGMGSLFSALGLARPETSTLPTLSERNPEAATGCEPEGPAVYVVDKATLDQRAQQLVNESIPPGTVPNPDPSLQTVLPLAGGPVASTPVAAATKAINDAVNLWAAGWVSRNVATYLSSYSLKFVPSRGLSRDAWMAQRKQSLANSGKIELSIENLKIDQKDATKATTTFRQVYRSERYQDVIQKTLEWENTDGRWLIVSETGAVVAVK
jgi:adhesin transport system outer membrane protein